MGPRDGLDVSEKRKICSPCRDSNPGLCSLSLYRLRCPCLHQLKNTLINQFSDDRYFRCGQHKLGSSVDLEEIFVLNYLLKITIYSNYSIQGADLSGRAV